MCVFNNSKVETFKMSTNRKNKFYYLYVLSLCVLFEHKIEIRASSKYVPLLMIK